MGTEKRSAANRANARKSTGPTTPAGRAKAAKNALSHGLCSAAPVVPGEHAAAWDAHRAGVVAALAPVGGLEEALADRVAACLWRLRRVVAFETAVTAAGVADALDAAATPVEDPFSRSGSDAARLEKAEEELAEARKDAELWADTAALSDGLAGLADDEAVDGEALDGLFHDLNAALPGDGDEYFDFEDAEFLSGLGVPEKHHESAWRWGGWTAAHVRQAVAAIASEFGADGDELVARAAASRREYQTEQAGKVAGHEAAVAAIRRRIDAKATRSVVRRGLPDADTLDKITRYESHLSRQALQSLHTLERWQAARSGRGVPPPAAGTLVLDHPPRDGGEG